MAAYKDGHATTRSPTQAANKIEQWRVVCSSALVSKVQRDDPMDFESMENNASVVGEPGSMPIVASEVGGLKLPE